MDVEAKMAKRIIVAILALFVTAAASAQTDQDFWGFYDPQNLETDAFVSGFAGAGAALTDEPGAVFLNPASLPVNQVAWGFVLDVAGLRNAASENAFMYSELRNSGSLNYTSSSRQFTSRELIPHFIGIWRSGSKWSFGTFIVWNEDYKMNYDLDGMSFWTAYSDNHWAGFDIIPKTGTGKIDKKEITFATTYSPNERLRIGLAVVGLFSDIDISSLGLSEAGHYWNWSQRTRGNFKKFVPQIGINYMAGNFDLACSYRFGVQSTLTSDCGTEVNPSLFHVGEKYIDPAVARAGISTKLGGWRLLLQYDYSWSGRQSGYVAVPSWEAPAKFRTDDEQVLRIGGISPKIESLKMAQFQLGYARSHYTGWYYPEKVNLGPDYLWNEIVLDCQKARFPKHSNLNLFTVGMTIPINKKWNITSGFNYSSLNRSFQVGVRYSI
jgi:hypothetical protein